MTAPDDPSRTSGTGDAPRADAPRPDAAPDAPAPRHEDTAATAPTGRRAAGRPAAEEPADIPPSSGGKTATTWIALILGAIVLVLAADLRDPEQRLGPLPVLRGGVRPSAGRRDLARRDRRCAGHGPGRLGAHDPDGLDDPQGAQASRRRPSAPCAEAAQETSRHLPSTGRTVGP
uniref:hypothetical protein n=1 Tax=Brachybacterium sp. GPGPB12 TaxID=3023517 RepID=UPI004049C562